MMIPPAELKVMEALWSRHPMTADEIMAQVAGPQGWGEATVKTLINRLLKRDAIASQRIDGRVRYTPLVQREAYVQTESQGLLDRLFDGRLAPLVAHFAQHRKLTTSEVEQLRKLIADLDETEADAGRQGARDGD